MKQLIREYFTFNKRERNGIFVLLSIILTLIGYLYFSDCDYQTEKIDFAKFEKEIQQLNNSSKHQPIFVDPKQEEKESFLPLVNERFRFDPNTLSEAGWKQLGLNDKQIHSIKKYQAKGGKFKRKEDLKKMYVISPEIYSSLESYIDIPPEEKANVSKKITPESNKVILFELNTVDSLQLITINGIGPFFAKSILKYRNLLGGYYSKQQLMEVWKFDEERYAKVEKYLTVDTSKITKININTCTANELKHPYLSWKMVNGIINYRMKHGNFTTLEEIERTDLLDNHAFLKLAPYLKLGK
jgi:DNA uptake protein ComE-like DNA-binding protein